MMVLDSGISAYAMLGRPPGNPQNLEDSSLVAAFEQSTRGEFHLPWPTQHIGIEPSLV